MTEILLILAEISWLMLGVVVVGCIMMAGLLNEEEPAAATTAFAIIILVISGIYVWNNSFSDYFNFIKSLNLVEYIPHVTIYLTIGVVWSVVKWSSYIRDKVSNTVKAINAVKNNWVNRSHDATTHEKYVSELVSAVNKETMFLTDENLRVSDLLAEDKNSLIPEKIMSKMKFTAQHKRGLITSWICYWPVSICSVFLQEFVIGLINNLFKSIQGVYNKISTALFSNAISTVIEEAKSEKLTALEVTKR